MKIYYHPASTTCRPVMLFIAENGIDAQMQLIDLFAGEHLKPPYQAINPNALVPMLEDGDFRLTEAAAILKYLADRIDSPAYPKDLRQRARVNERMDWLNTQFSRDFVYGFVYPQILPMFKRANPEVQAATLAWGRDGARRWLKVLDEHLIGPKNAYLGGNQLTIADYFGASFVALGEIVGCDYAAYPNVRRWLAAMKQLKGWKKVNEAIDGYAASLKGAPLEAI